VDCTRTFIILLFDMRINLSMFLSNYHVITVYKRVNVYFHTFAFFCPLRGGQSASHNEKKSPRILYIIVWMHHTFGLNFAKERTIFSSTGESKATFFFIRHYTDWNTSATLLHNCKEIMIVVDLLNYQIVIHKECNATESYFVFGQVNKFLYF